MATSLRAFKVRLYEEHLEEASFLYCQRRVLLEDPTIPWSRVEDFERRLEAHLDALVLGGDLALEICREHAAAGDTGELFAAAAVVCRLLAAPLFAEILEALDEAEPERGQALADALKFELPDSWRDSCVRALRQGTPHLQSILAEVVGHRRIDSHGALSALAANAQSESQAMFLWAIGRTREAGAIASVRAGLGSSSESIYSTALRAGLRLHDLAVLDHLSEFRGEPQVTPIDLALAGGGSATWNLLRRLDRGEPAPQLLLALGLLGDLAAIPRLLHALAEPLLAASAADALYTITGAPLFEVVLIPDPVSRDELFDKELRTYRETGELPHRGDGEPFGSRVRRLSRDPAAWHDWLRSHTTRFISGVRYRCGNPSTAGGLLRSLGSDTFPKHLRPLTAEELQIRYGIDLPFEVDMFVAQQRQVLAQADTWAARTDSYLESGHWYFGSRPVS